ncbi:MAG: hypothetical protein LC658_09770 [Bacteroidales bacterium]|nr:hypothetical protein [Bacteroidales bacterium]
MHCYGNNGSLMIHQNAFISAIDAGESTETTYQLQSAGNGVYFMVTEGAVIIEETNLEKRDAAGFWSFSEPLKIQFKQQTSLLAIEVPMN